MLDSSSGCHKCVNLTFTLEVQMKEILTEHRKRAVRITSFDLTSATHSTANFEGHFSLQESQNGLLMGKKKKRVPIR